MIISIDEEAFDKTGKSTAKAFDSEVKGFINKKDNNKVNIILLDKNYPNGIGNFMKTFCKNKNNTKVIVFVPKINKALLFEGEITKDGKTEKKNISQIKIRNALQAQCKEGVYLCGRE